MARLVAVDTTLLVRRVTNVDPLKAERAAATDCDAMLSFDAPLISSICVMDETHI